MMDPIQKLKSKDWRINHLYKINTKDSRLITFKEFDIQKKIRLSRARRKLVLKSRQLGITTGAVVSNLTTLFGNQIQTPA